MSKEQLNAEWLWNHYDEALKATAPTYCPNCAANLHGPSGSLVAAGEDEVVWDTYCPVCDWSGYISPDEKLSGEGSA